MVQCGIFFFATDKSMQPAEIARAVEERGLDGLFLPEHTHFPCNSVSPYFKDQEIPEPYRRTYDPFVALATCAAVTSRIRLGTGVALVAQHDPIALAKTVASLDRLSGGRVTLGVGCGWNEPEFENHGHPFKMRWRIVREYVLAMKAMWRDEISEFHGEYVNFDPMLSYPKPLQAGGPPIWIGANSKYIPDRVAEYGDGWTPVGGYPTSGTVEQLKDACAKRGRRFEDLTLGLFFAPTKEERCRALMAEGYTELVFAVPSEGADTVLPRLDTLAKLAEKLKAP
jgi:probable F420-dependent oxidoreductase